VAILSIHRLRRAEYMVIVSIVLFVALMLLVSFLAGGESILQHIGKINMHVVAGLLFLSLVNYVARLLRWHLFSKRINVRVPLRRNALYYVAGFSMTTTPGKIGEALRLWLIERCHEYGYDRVTPLLLGDRLGDLNAMVLLCLVGLSVFSGYYWSVFLTVAGFIALTFLFMKPRYLIGILNRLYACSGYKRARGFAKARRALRITTRLFTWRIFGATLLLSVFGWLAECIAFYWLLNELGASVSLLQAIFIFAFAMIAGAISMLPGGLVGVEATMMGLLLALGTNLDVGLAATAVIRLTTLWFAVGLGFIALPFALRLARKPQHPRKTPEGLLEK